MLTQSFLGWTSPGAQSVSLPFFFPSLSLYLSSGEAINVIVQNQSERIGGGERSCLPCSLGDSAFGFTPVHMHWTS